MNKKVLIIVGILLLLAIIFFVSNMQKEISFSEKPDIKGTIYSITEDGFLVAEGFEGESYQGDIDKLRGEAFWFKINQETEIMGQEGETLQFTDLEVNDKVSVWSTGLVLESYPAQTSAARIIVTEKAEKNIGLANPASLYCEEQGGDLEIRTDNDGSQKGFCLFSDGSECEEWAFFEERCKESEIFCKDLCGDGFCQEIVCSAIGCPCSETPESCPLDCI
jgi:putative hemolysin